MKGKIVLVPKQEIHEYTYDFDISLAPGIEYVVCITTDLSEDYKSLISTTKDMEESIKDTLLFMENPECISILMEAKKDMLGVLQNAEYVSFGFDIEEVAKYVKANPILKTKKILFYDIYDFNPETIKKIEDNFGNDTSNIYFDVLGNDQCISFSEYKATVEVVDNTIQKIEALNLSTLEKIMYVYDITRDRVYKEETENEKKTDSRDLTSVLLGDKIVCAGYARLFDVLLEKLGISAKIVHLYNEEYTTGHARVEVHVKDDKYGVDGVYYFDPTWDSKRNADDTDYLLSYRFFAMTKQNIDNIDRGKRKDDRFPYFTSDIAWELDEIVDEKGFEGVPQDMVKSINYMSNTIDNRSLINRAGLIPDAPAFFKLDKDKIVGRLDELVTYFDTPLSADILLKVLFNVRKNQYYINPEKYSLTLDDFYNVVLNSKWEFDDKQFNRFILDLATEEELIKIKAIQITRYSEETDLGKNIERVKLAKVLRRVCDKKRNEKLD